MSICSRQLRFASLAGLGASLQVLACFDVEQVEVSGLLIDDFEDGDQEPVSAHFAVWNCYPFQTDAAWPTCEAIAPGFRGGRAEALVFKLEDPPEGVEQSSVGVGLGLFPPVGTVDLSSWRRLRFMARFEASNPASTDGTRLWIRLPCDTVDHPPGPAGFSVQHAVEVGRDWSAFAPAWDEFEQPSFQKTPIYPPDCVRRVDQVEFQIQLIDGQAGTLTLDDVYLE